MPIRLSTDLKRFLNDNVKRNEIMKCKITRRESYQASVDPRSNDIQHFKYLKKKKVDGKWRYYYDVNHLKNDLGFDEKEELKSAKRNLASAKDAYDEQYKYTQNNWKSVMSDREHLKAVAYNTKRITDNYDKAKRRVDKAVKEYNNTPIGKLENFVNEGKQNLKKLFGSR